MIDINDLSFSYGEDCFMEHIHLHLQKGKITSIIGPNGSGKSTLLMLIARILHPKNGSIYIQEKDIKEYSLKRFAQQVAVVHQKNTIVDDVSVETIVGYGRLPYLHYYQSYTKEDYEIINWALEITGLSELKHHYLKTLSGGQQQRVWIAMALAQKTPIFLLDEPTTYLDIKYQIDVLNLIQKINQELQITIVMVHHDINQAMYYSHQIIAMKQGTIFFQGNAEDVIKEVSLRKLYDCNFEIIEHLGKRIILNVQAKTK